MDRIDALIAMAHLRVRLERIKKNPRLLEEGLSSMGDIVKRAETAPVKLEIARPIELAGMKSRLIRAKKMSEDIKVTGMRMDQVLDAIDEVHDATKRHVGDLEQYNSEARKQIESMIDRSNGGDPLDGQTGQDGQTAKVGAGQIVSSETPREKQTISADEVGTLDKEQ